MELGPDQSHNNNGEITSTTLYTRDLSQRLGNVNFVFLVGTMVHWYIVLGSS